MATKTVTSIDQIRQFNGRVYVRWARSITLDNRRGYSLRYGTQAEAGLSCCEIDRSWDDWRILRQIQEYQFVGGDCWIITGDRVGTGGDNEPLLANVIVIGKAGHNLITANWRRMQLEAEIAADVDRLARITDHFAIEIIMACIARNRAELAKIS